MLRVLETRVTREGYRRRRYQDSDGSRFTTLEVPFELGIQLCRLEAIAEATGTSAEEWLAGEEARLGITDPNRATPLPRKRRSRG